MAVGWVLHILSDTWVTMEANNYEHSTV